MRRHRAWGTRATERPLGLASRVDGTVHIPGRSLRAPPQPPLSLAPAQGLGPLGSGKGTTHAPQLEGCPSMVDLWWRQRAGCHSPWQSGCWGGSCEGWPGSTKVARGGRGGGGGGGCARCPWQGWGPQAAAAGNLAPHPPDCPGAGPAPPSPLPPLQQLLPGRLQTPGGPVQPGAEAGIPGIPVRFDIREKQSARRFLTGHLLPCWVPWAAV